MILLEKEGWALKDHTGGRFSLRSPFCMLWSSFWLSVLKVEVLHGILDALLDFLSPLALCFLQSVLVVSLTGVYSSVVFGDLVLDELLVTDGTKDGSPAVEMVDFAHFVA